MVTLGLPSPGNGSSSSPDHAPQGRNGPRGLEMLSSDVQDRVFRAKLEKLHIDNPHTPLMFLMYTLCKTDQNLECARMYLQDNKWTDTDVSSIPVTSLHGIRNAELREKVQDITESLGTTVWWTAYALRVCNGSVDEASGLLTEGVINATINPWESGMSVDADNTFFTGSAEMKVEPSVIKNEPKALALPYSSPALGNLMTPSITPNVFDSLLSKTIANYNTGRMNEGIPFRFKSESKSKTGRVIDESSDDEMTLSSIKDDISPSTGETSNTEDDQIKTKIKQMMELLPNLTAPECMTSLELSGGDVSEAIELELENLREESVVGNSPRTPPSSSRGAAVQPQKRTSSTPDDHPQKRIRLHDNDKDVAVLPEAGQWVRLIFRLLRSPPVTINLADEKTREIPRELLIWHSSYFRERLEGNGKQPEVTEIDLKDVNCILFDCVIQYMFCWNVSFGDMPTLRPVFITTIVKLLALSTKLEIQGISTVLLAICEDTLKEARKSATTSSILKAIHIHKAYKHFGKSHPLRKLLVKACVRPYMQAGTTYNGSESDSDSDSDSNDLESDEEEEKVPTAIQKDALSRQEGYLAYRFNRDFKIDLICAADKVRRNRVSVPKKAHGRNPRDVVTLYTDPLDSKQFEI